jgi:hypothetical protein
MKLTATKLLDQLFELQYFHARGRELAAIRYHRSPGKGRLVLIVGENASGKSLARRLIALLCKEHSAECIGISMQGRRNVAYNIGLTFVYGSEDYQSTGENSVGTVLGAITTAKARTKDHVVFWDEPDLGLSDAWAASVGAAIRKFAQEPPDHTRAIFVVTHSKALVAQLLEALPHFVYFGNERNPPTSAAKWLTSDIVVRDLETLQKVSHARFLAIQKILNRNKQKTGSDA